MADFDVTVEDLLFMSSATEHDALVQDPLNETSSHTVAVAQTIVAVRETVTGNSVTVSHTITLTNDLGRALADTLTLTQNLHGVIIYANLTSGQTASQYLDPAAQVAYANLAPTKTVTFSRSGSSITLRAPDWGDRDHYEVVRIQEESRGRTLIVYQDSIWPKTEILTLNFSYLSQEQADSLLAFIRANTGYSIDYTDHLGRQWSGYILNPDTELRQVSRNNRVITLTYQGELQ